MTKQDLQKELKEKVKEGVKPSQLKKLKRSKSDSDLPPSPKSQPLQHSKSQLEIPLNQPSSKEQITNLKEQVKFHAETASNYLKSLQSSQAKVSELETQIKNNPPAQLLTDQLQEKQKEIEELRKRLEETNQELNSLKKNHSSLLDTNLSLKHQGLKDWWEQYEKTKEFEKELKENVDYASNELIEQDKTIEKLRGENSKIKKEKESLKKDLDLAEKLAELRKNPYYSPDNNWTYLKYGLYSLAVVLFTLWLVKSFKNIRESPVMGKES